MKYINYAKYGYSNGAYELTDEMFLKLGNESKYGIYHKMETLNVNDAQSTKIKLYPNPASEILNISHNNSEIRSIEIIDMAGKIVLKKTVSGKNISLDVSRLTKGNYIISIRTNDEKKNIKFIKN